MARMRASESTREALAAGLRLTASDRPGVAQPVPEREIPAQSWRPIAFAAAVMFVAMIGAWEWYWRDFGVTPSYRNSNGQWAQQRRRIDEGEGGRTVLIGSSRMLFDVQLPVWERLTGERPIQLAMEGTSAMPTLDDLAGDPNFTGRLLIDITPLGFFATESTRADIVPYFHRESPSDRIGTSLSMALVEPYLAFYDPDFALATIVRRQAWPERPGAPLRALPRKLVNHDIDRNSRMWTRIETDPAYHALVRQRWAQTFNDPLPPDMDTPEKAARVVDAKIAHAQAAIDVLRRRGVRIALFRPPSTGPFLERENRLLPREKTWDLLVQRTGLPAIHFEDYPELQGYELPEWSHLSESEACRFTAALVPIVEREFAKLEARND
ncbi:MAG: hypothetical protein ABW186_13805 [Rhodanobacteraceae bacterium]